MTPCILPLTFNKAACVVGVGQSINTPSFTFREHLEILQNITIKSSFP